MSVHYLQAVRVPTLVLHRHGDMQVPVEHGRDLAAHPRRAIYRICRRRPHPLFTAPVEATAWGYRRVHDRTSPQFARTTSIAFSPPCCSRISSIRRAAPRTTGDRAWRKLLDSHDELALQVVEKHRGTLIKSTGDGILATFDGPARGVRCALALGTATRQIGLPIRAGLHTGEIEIRGRDIGGVAVHAASRVMTQSQPDEVLVSRVVTDLVAGAGLTFAGRGSHELKGLPGRWDLFAASI